MTLALPLCLPLSISATLQQQSHLDDSIWFLQLNSLHLASRWLLSEHCWASSVFFADSSLKKLQLVSGWAKTRNLWSRLACSKIYSSKKTTSFSCQCRLSNLRWIKITTTVDQTKSKQVFWIIWEQVFGSGRQEVFHHQCMWRRQWYQQSCTFEPWWTT